jgi:predicted CoA-binding protein
VIDRERLDAFLALDSLLFLGASRGGKKFGNLLLRALRDRGTQIHPVHPDAELLEGLPCLHSVADVPAGVEGAVLVLKPAAVAAVLPDLAAAGIRQVWVQQGGESPQAGDRAMDLVIDLIQGHCLLMFLPEVAWVHRFHHRISAWMGRVPA